MQSVQKSGVRIRSIALPTEHGGWGFVSEPIILGLLVAPSWAGLAFGLATFAVFLLRQPLKLWIKDSRAKRSVPRTDVACQFTLMYGGIALVGVAIALGLTRNLLVMFPLLIAVPIALLQLSYDSRGKSRALIPEIAGAVAIGAAVSVIVLMGDLALTPAVLLWLLLALRAATSIQYVRSRLRLEYNKPANVSGTWIAHLLMLIALSGLIWRSLLPMLSIIPFVVLGIRAAWGLSPMRRPVKPKVVGFTELAYGILTVTVVALAFRMA
jgi:hypothetical protein